MRSSRDAEVTEYVQARLPWLRRVAYLLCQDWQSADDLVQAGITRLYVNWDRARGAASIDAYARTVLVRTFLAERRSAWARRVTLSGAYPDMPAAATDHDSRLDVRDALVSLPPRQRATLVLRFYCDLPVEETDFVDGQSSYVTRLGVRWVYRVLSEPDRQWQSLCATGPVNGLGGVVVIMDMNTPGSNAPLPGSAELGGVLGVFTRLRFLGTHASAWTTTPLG